MKVSTDAKKIKELLTRGVKDVIEQAHLEKRLRAGEKLRVKFGIDPTGPVLHLGHSVVLRLLRRFQELGHTVIFLVGDFTATIGDPTGRIESRPPLSEKEISQNMKTYTKQAGLVLDMKKVEVRHNSEWYGKMSVWKLLQLMNKVTAAQVGARRDFRKRLAADEDFSFTEFSYPILQGYDSVMLRADVEVGGTDQLFNMLMGRRIQKRHKQKPQDVVTAELLEGLDGVQKMSKTAGNYIALKDTPNNMYGKTMLVSDSLIFRYFELCTDAPMTEIVEMKKKMKKGANPRDFKAKLAHTLVSAYHSKAAADRAERHFVKLFKEHKAPEKMKVVKVKKTKWNIVDLLVHAKLAASKSDARRLLEQGGIKIDSHTLEGSDVEVLVTKKGHTLQRGKRHFVRIVKP